MTLNTGLAPTLISPGLILRPAHWSDAEAASRLTRDYWTAQGDPALTISAADMRTFWRSPGLRLETDVWVVETSAGKLVGYEEFYNRHEHSSLVGEGYVHPRFVGKGIGTALLRALLRRAWQESSLAEPDVRVFLRNGVAGSDSAGRDLHVDAGFHPVRFAWRMQIVLDAEPTAVWPAGVDLRTFDRETQDRRLFETHEEAFSEHYGHTPGKFENWQHHVSGREGVDPSLWHIAWDADRIAGYSICNLDGAVGWVDKIGVLRPWRRRGLGLALLQQSFAEFWRRDIHTVSLGTDASNPTGATRLYQRAGMRMASEIVRYEKELRPGRDAAG